MQQKCSLNLTDYERFFLANTGSAITNILCLVLGILQTSKVASVLYMKKDMVAIIPALIN